MRPEDFYNQYIGQAIDYDGSFGVQCVDGFKVFCSWAGIPVKTTGNGWANGYWLNRDALGFSEYFDYIEDPSQLQDGDWAIWDKGSSCPNTHVAMYYQGKSFGQNQGGNGAFSLVNVKWDIMGALRWKGWNNDMSEIPTGYSTIRYNGIDFHCYKQDPNTEMVTLLSIRHPATAKLSTIVTDDFDVVAKKNASFFVMSTGYINGSEVSDLYDEAVPNGQEGWGLKDQGFIDVVQLKDGSWKFGNLGCADYRKDKVNLRYSTGACLIAGGAYSEEYSQSCGASVLTDNKIQSCLGVDWSNNAIFITTSPNQPTTPYVLREFGLAYGLQYLFRDDGGGSAELVVNEKIMNGVANERALPNCLAICKVAEKEPDKEPDPTTEEPEPIEPEIESGLMAIILEFVRKIMDFFKGK